MGSSTTSRVGLSTLLFIPCLLLLADAATFTVTNQCSYTVWAAAVAAGGQKLGSGGQKMGPGATWTVTVKPGTTGGRIWARTGCNFDASGRGHCQTGDCGGVLACTAYGVPPDTLAEFGLNQFSGLDFFDISLVDGFNVPMNFLPDSGRCTKGPHCAVNVAAQCPSQLKAPGGCNNPCTVFKTDQYCCNSGSCSPTDYSKFFKRLCPEAYSYPKDDPTSTFTCPGGTNYKVVFCPRSNTNDLIDAITSIVV